MSFRTITMVRIIDMEYQEEALMIWGYIVIITVAARKSRRDQCKENSIEEEYYVVLVKTLLTN